MKNVLSALFTSAVTTAAALAPAHAESLKIGMILTISGSAAINGEQARNGFMLALDQLGGQLGGVETEVLVVDAEQKPDVAAARAEELVTRENVDIVVGPIFSNIFVAIAKPVLDADKFIISPNSGPSVFAGEGCHENLFVVSYQNDQPHEVLGAYANQAGFERVFVMAPNYQAGKDAVNGFKHSFDGEVVGEVYTPLGQLDFSAELAQIALARPDALYTFMPGGMGVNLVKQYSQAGLGGLPFLSAFTVDEGTLPAQQDAALGMKTGTTWAPNFDNPRSAAFADAYEAMYDQIPATYAMNGYDTAMLIDSAVRAVGGDLSDQDALRAALEAADFQSLRGNFRFGNNHFPIQDFYLAEAIKREDGKFETAIVQKIFTDYQDNYAAQCDME